MSNSLETPCQETVQDISGFFLCLGFCIYFWLNQQDKTRQWLLEVNSAGIRRGRVVALSFQLECSGNPTSCQLFCSSTIGSQMWVFLAFSQIEKNNFQHILWLISADHLQHLSWIFTYDGAVFQNPIEKWHVEVLNCNLKHSFNFPADIFNLFMHRFRWK